MTPNFKITEKVQQRSKVKLFSRLFRLSFWIVVFRIIAVAWNIYLRRGWCSDSDAAFHMEIKNTNNSLRDDVRNLLFLYPDKISLELSFMITVTS